jgi:hypothetical protein
MATYRLYCLDRLGSISLADWIEAPDDEDAVRQAHELKNGSSKCEVWERRRLVASLEAGELAMERQA